MSGAGRVGAPRERGVNLILVAVRESQEGRKVAILHRRGRNRRRAAVEPGAGIANAFVPEREEGLVSPVIQLRDPDRTGGRPAETIGVGFRTRLAPQI